jgi:hypothetical protein
MISRKKNSEQQNTEDQESSDSEYKIKLSIQIGDRIIESDLEDSLMIPTIDKLNPTVVANMFAELPSVHGRWNFLYNEAAFEYDMLKTKLDVWMAKKSQEYRKLLSMGDGKITEKLIDDTLKSDPEYKELNDELAKSKKNMKHVLALANGFGEKGDRLTSIAMMMKWEAENLSGYRKSATTASGKQYSHIKNDEPITDWPS